MHQYVSIIIPTYNRREFLRKALDSVLRQTYPYFEIIVVDDGSNDGTADMLTSYGSSIKYLHQNNQGPAAARNTGVKASRYDLVAFLDSDDCFTESKLEIHVAAMEDQPEYLISHTDEIWYRRGTLLNQKKKHKRPDGQIFANCLPLCAVGMSTTMVRKSLFDKVGLFDEELPCCEDYDLWLRASIHLPFLLINQPLTIKDGGRPDQVSFIHRVGMDRFRIRSIQKVLSSGQLDSTQTKLANEELVRKCRIYGNGCLKHGRTDEGQYYLDLARRIGEK